MYLVVDCECVNVLMHANQLLLWNSWVHLMELECSTEPIFEQLVYIKIMYGHNQRRDYTYSSLNYVTANFAT